jgi:L-alanine-DL-glutamate epimerase-like enolase superfamily enzyme
MKITRLTTYAVPPRWLFLKIETDDGIVGWGNRSWRAGQPPSPHALRSCLTI